MGELNDEELMRLYLGGDFKAFDKLYRRLSPKVYGYLKSRGLNNEDADDLLQKIFLKFHKSSSSYNEKYPVLQWLFVMSKSALLDFKKSEFRKNRIEGEFKVDLELNSPSLSQNEAKVSLSEQMPNHEVLATLKPEIQGLVKMRVLDELSFAEMAQLTGASEASLRQILSRALKKLRNTFVIPGRREKF